MKKILALAAAAVMCFGLTACASSGNGMFSGAPGTSDGGSGGNPSYFYDVVFDAPDGYGEGNYNYNEIIETGFTSVEENATSYFSLDRNTATYSLVRSQLNYGYPISPDSVRIEEMINYFDYDFPAPQDQAIAVTGYLSDCPWNEESKLMLVGLKTAEYNLTDVNANYVFLIDVSGSMSGDNRIGLAKKGLNMLVDELGDNDLISIVTYASGVSTVLEGGECSASGKTEIKKAVSSLTASGSTNGSGGIQRAYEIAEKYFITGGNNRVIIISDGDFNVGISNLTDLKELIQDKAASGVYLSALGVGLGNMRDDVLETLATCGNGNYAYLDNETEARKVFVDELNGTLKTVAKDAKAGVTFTENVAQYRLIGYDTKHISEDDFNNVNADAGEIGSNLCVAALYEIQLAQNDGGAEDGQELPTQDAADSASDLKLADAEIRYKDVTGETEYSESVRCEITLSTPTCDDLRFIGCVAEFGLILRQSQYRGTASFASLLERLECLNDYIDGDPYKQEFVTLAGIASEYTIYGNAE